MTNKVQHEIGIQALLNKKTAEIINMIDTKQFDPKSLFGKVKLKKSVSANLKLMPLKWVKDNYKLFFVDSETLQRFLQEWKKSKIDSYLSTVFGGLAHKDLFQLADIKKIVNAYKDRLEDETLNKDEKIALEDSYNYFKSLEDKKFTFLVLDGQHRLKYLYQYLNNEITFDVLKDYFSEIEIIGLERSFSINMSGKYFNELPSPIQIHLLYNITIPVTFFYSGSIKVLAYTFVASNDGNPMSWHEKRSVLCKNNFVRFFISYSLQHAEREKFWAKIAKVNLLKKEDTLFHSLIFPWYLQQRKNCKVSVPSNYNFSLNNSDFLFDEMFNVSDNYLQDYKKVFDEVLKVIVVGKPNKRNKKIKYTELFDLFYIIHTFTERGFSDYTYKITNYVKFLIWFIKGESNRKNRDRFVVDKNGEFVLDPLTYKKIEKKHSFASKLKEQNSDNFNFRINEILKDIENDINNLVETNVIQAIGSRKSSLSIVEVAEDTNFIDVTGAQIPEEFVYTDHGPNYEIHEEIPVSQGGKRELNNVNLSLPKHNKETYNIQQKYEKGGI